jgi:porin
MAYARISSSARGFDLDTAFFNPDSFNPIRSSEAMVEVTYQAQIVPGWTVQPDFQYIWRPGGNVLNPRAPVPEVTKDATIVGLRTTIRY